MSEGSERNESSTVLVSTAGPLPLDHYVWGQRKLLERVVQRHFTIVEDAGSSYAWLVKPLGESPPLSLFELKDELEPLGWLPLLDPGEPLILAVESIPTRHYILPRRSLWLGWGVVAVCLTFIGAAWVQRLDPERTASNLSVVIEGLFGFALPMLTGIWLASEARRIVALRRGVRLDPMLPFAIPFPITTGAGLLPLGIAGAAPIWPFGIVALIDPRRVDHTPHPDRSSLAWTSLAAPLTLMLIGALFEIVGLMTTPNRPSAIGAPPFALHLNPLVSILANLGIGDSLGYRVQWVSAFGLAGHGLSMLGWILLLPIPNFPGDHLVSAMVGPSKSLESAHQTMLFALMILIAVWVFLRSGFWPWILLAIIGSLRRFYPDLNPLPLVIDEWSPLEERESTSLSVILIAFAMLGFPGWVPLVAIDGWQDGFTLDEWPEMIEVEPGVPMSHSMELAPSGVLARDGWIWLTILDEAPDWDVEWRCDGQMLAVEQHCFFSEISDQNPLALALVVKSPTLEGANDRVRVQIWLSSDSDEVNKTTILVPMILPRFDTSWERSTSDISLLCGNITLGPADSGNLTSATPGWSVQSGVTVAGPGIETVCISGPDGLNTTAPRVELQHDNGNVTRLGALFNVDDGVLTSDADDGGRGSIFGAAGTFPEMANGSLIIWLDDDALHCPPLALFPSPPDTENWSWDLRSDPLLTLPFDESGELLPGRIIFPSYGQLLSCGPSGQLQKVWRLADGPDAALLVNGTAVAYGGPWFGSIGNDVGVGDGSDSGNASDVVGNNSSLALLRFAVRNVGNESIIVSGEMTGDPGALDLISGVLPISVPSNSTVSLDIQLLDRDGASAWLWSEVTEDGILLHLVARCDTADCGS